MADQDIIINFTLNSQGVVEGAKTAIEAVNKLKASIIEVSKSTGSTYKEAADALTTAFEQAAKAQAKSKVDPLSGPNSKSMKDAMRTANEQAKEYGRLMTKALNQINDAEAKVVRNVELEGKAQEAATRAVIARSRLTATTARTKAKEERADASLYVAKSDASAQVAQAEAASKAQIAASKATADAEAQAQTQIRDQIKTTVTARMAAAATMKAEAKAQAEAEIARASVIAKNSELIKKAAEADKAQAAARVERAKATEAEAKASQAAANELEKTRKAQADADKAVAEAQIKTAEVAHAAQMAQAKADSMTAASANATAVAESKKAKAITDQAIAAKAGAIADEKLAQEQNKTAQSAANAAKAQDQLAKQMNGVPDQSGRFAGVLGKLNGVLRLVFGTALGITAVKALTSFRNTMQEAITTSVEFTKVQFGLALALREIQRRGGEVDFDKVNDEIEALYKKFGIFSKKEITQGFTDIALRLSRFGATADQVGKIMDVALVLKMTDVENRFDSVDEAAKVLATYLGSGYGEGLERAGAIAGRSADQLIAFENGMKTLYGSGIDPLQRAMLRINFLFKQFSGQMDDASKYVETASGRIDRANAKIKDAMLALGDAMRGATVKATEAWADFVDKFVTDVAPGIEESIIQLITLMDTFSSKFKDFQDSLGIKSVEDQRVKEYQSLIDALNKGRSKSEEKYLKSITEFFDKLKQWQPEEYKKMQTMFPKEFEDYLKYTGQLDERIKGATDSSLTFAELWRKNYNELKAEFEGLGKEAKDMFDTPPGVEGPIVDPSIVDEQKVKDAQDEITKAVKDAEKDRLELERKYWEDVGQVSKDELPGLLESWNSYFASSDQITQDGVESQQAIWEQAYGEFGNILNDALNKAMDIWRDYYQKLEDIAQKELQNIADENINYAQALQDNRRDMQQKLEDAARKYREAELKAERDYQEKLRRLREEYLFDLEDALRERDALQVIRLMRRYALDKAQLEREHENDKEDRAEAYRQELEDIRLQAQRKEEELRIEHQRRLEEIALQAQREREQAEIDRQRAMDALKEDIEKEKAQRAEKYKQDQADLETALTERIKTILEKLVEEGELTQDQLTKMSTALQTWAANTIKTHWDVANQIAAATASIIASLQAQQAAQQAAAAYNPGVNSSTLSPVQQANYGSNGSYTPPPPSAPSGFWPNSSPPYSGGNGSFGHAKGGTEYASTPTWALYGEAGPEVATFTPLSKLNTRSKSPVGDSNMPGAAGANGKVKVEVYLSPDLVGRVIDDTLGQSAQIIEEALSRR